MTDIKTVKKQTQLTAQDISLILEAAAKNGVSAFKWGNLAFRIGQKPQNYVQTTGFMQQEMPNHDEINANTLVNDEVQTKEEQMDMALIENPLLFEQMLAAGELTEEDETKEEVET